MKNFYIKEKYYKKKYQKTRLLDRKAKKEIAIKKLQKEILDINCDVYIKDFELEELYNKLYA